MASKKIEAKETVKGVSGEAAVNRDMPKTSPYVVVLFGGTGDLARRKLLPGLLHLYAAGMLPDVRVVATSLDDIDTAAYRKIAAEACEEYAHGSVKPEIIDDFCTFMSYISIEEGPLALAKAVEEAESELPEYCRRLHYLSVPPHAAGEVVANLGSAGLAERARVIMEKPFGTDLASARKLNAEVQKVFTEDQLFRIDHFLGKEAAQNILAFRFANGLFEPIWNRQHIDHIQIDVPETISVGSRGAFYEQTGAFRDMVVTHLFQILAFVAMEPPTALEPKAISEEKNKVFRSLQLLDPAKCVRGQYEGYRWSDGVSETSDTETLIALQCEINNWRWAGVPFFLRTGKRMAASARIVSIAFREPPNSMFPSDSGVGAEGPDHLTFDLADSTTLALSFYGKKPGPGMKLSKLSLQFSMQSTGEEGNILEAYERLIFDAMQGDHTLFTNAEGIERVWELSEPLLKNPPEVELYRTGSWGPHSLHELIAPRTWRLPIEET